MATPKSQRQPPSRIFENYVLTRVVAPNAGLTEIADSAFTTISGSIDGGTNVSDGSADDAVSNLTSIGFDFVFDQVTYRRFCVCTNGWLALADPTATSGFLVSSQLLNSASYQNQGISLGNASQSVLLAPWFDDLRNVASNVSDVVLQPDVVNRIQYGYQRPPISYNPTAFGVKIFRDKRSQEGKRLIIRWNSLSDFSHADTILAFECVLYENGVIEYRYIPRSAITLIATPAESATIGIFAPGTNRFRDFSFGLGHRDETRQQYRYGGTTFDTTYDDSARDDFTSKFISRKYTWTLKPQLNWPGQSQFGAIFRFAPPQNRRKILPRNLIREFDSRFESQSRFFDDRRSTAFVSGTVVNYPTTLPRFTGDSEANVADRQNLFNSSGAEFEITGSIVKSAIDQFLEIHDTSVIKPFGEQSRFDQSPVARMDAFFISGSGVDTGTRLDYPLWSKSQLRFSLPVNYTTTLFPLSASIYYYNKRLGIWVLPNNTTPDSQGSDIASAAPYALNGRIIEDHRGFGPVGNSLTSGSNDPSGTGGTDVRINSSYTPGNATSAMLRMYAKSVSANNEYEATVDETFGISVDSPFLIEKAVFEIPFAFGPGWFADRTTSFLPIVPTSGSFDFAGPGLTVALYNQIKVNNHTRRDLIMTGTITHTGDMSSSVVLSNFPPITNDFQLRPVGYLAFADAPGSIVTPTSGNFYTGSVIIKSEALISNGVTLKFGKDMVQEPSSQYPTNRTEILNLISLPNLTIVSSSAAYSLGYNIAFIDSFGRGATGFDPSPRSILGKEFSTTQGVVTKGKIANPFYLTGSAYNAISSSLASGNRFRAVAALPLGSHYRSPYLMMPGDKLVMSLAKSRPFFYSSGLGGPDFSGSIAHDIQLIPGTINVTLYGSYLREGKEFHDVFKTKLTSDSIHEAIGNDPVFDEYELAYRDEYVGGFSDDFVTGSLASTIAASNQILKILTGSRGRVFSKFSARTQPPPDESPGESTTNTSKNFRLQPWWERVGTPRVISHVDSSERFFDTLMPDVSTAFAQDGCKIFLGKQSAYLLSNFSVANLGFMYMNDPNVGATGGPVSDYDKLRNLNWTRSFPFEPRYRPASRQKNIKKSFVAKLQYNGSNNPLLNIDPVIVSGLVIQTAGRSDVFASSQNIKIPVDADVSTKITSSCNLEDTSRLLFGFGDKNTIAFQTDIFGATHQFGTNHWFDFRTRTDPSSANEYNFGPILRGWKYGVWNGMQEYSRARYRHSRFGQNRDMLEQRLFTKFYLVASTDSGQLSREGVTTSPITVRFVDALGNATAPENTQSQNLSFEATSSVPFFDGEIRNRPDLNPNTQNSSITSFKTDVFGNVAL